MNDAPTADLSGPIATGNNYSTTYRTSVGSIPIAYSTSTVTDLDNATMTSLTVTITNVQNINNEVLTFTLPGGISASAPSNTAATVVFTGSASPSTYQTLLRSIQYRNLRRQSDARHTPFDHGRHQRRCGNTVCHDYGHARLAVASHERSGHGHRRQDHDGRLAPHRSSSDRTLVSVGPDLGQVAQLQSTTYVVANLGLARELGQASSGKIITIDDNAAGFVGLWTAHRATIASSPRRSANPSASRRA